MVWKAQQSWEFEQKELIKRKLVDAFEPSKAFPQDFDIGWINSLCVHQTRLGNGGGGLAFVLLSNGAGFKIGELH